MISWIAKYASDETKAAPLAVFRILFGLLMGVSMVRFWYHGWIEKLYIDPVFHFKYLGFSWIQVPGDFTYVLFIICGVSALCIALGMYYGFATVVFFLSFTYIELMDKTTYLNHYYFISILSFILIWLPAANCFSVDAWRGRIVESTYVQKWCIDSIKIVIAIVYTFAGMAKLNSDWLIHAMPLAIWLPSKFDLPILGSLVHERWIHFAFSWGGAVYDLSIVLLLLWRRTRVFGFVLVIIFHVLTRVLFPIGMFPYVMILGTLIFFSSDFHEKLLSRLRRVLQVLTRSKGGSMQSGEVILRDGSMPWRFVIVGAVLILQLIFPWRYLLCPGSVFWHEAGYRFSWRVMLMEKTGYATFRIVNAETGRKFTVQNDDFLTAFQQKQMATQPDFIVEFGQYLGDHFTEQGHEHVQVFVDSYAALNGRGHQRLVDPDLDLMEIDRWDFCRDYVVPLSPQ